MRTCWRGVLRRSYRCCPGRREVHVGALPSSSSTAREQPRWTAGTLHTALTRLLVDEPDTRRRSSIQVRQHTLPSLSSHHATTSQPTVKAESIVSSPEPRTASPLSSSSVHVSIRELKDEGTLLRRLLLARRRASRARRAQLENDKARSVTEAATQHPNILPMHTPPSTIHTVSSNSTSVAVWQRAYVLFVDAVQRDAVLPTTQHINLLLQLALRAEAWHIVDQLADFHARFLHAVRRLQRERAESSQSIGEAGTCVPHAERSVQTGEDSNNSTSVVLYHNRDASHDIQSVTSIHCNNSYCSNSSMSQEVIELRHMESMLQPNTQTYAVLMQAALCRRQWQSVLELYEDMCMMTMNSTTTITSVASCSTVHMTDTILRHVLQAYAHTRPDVTCGATSSAHLTETSASWQAAYVLYLRHQTCVQDVRTLHVMLRLLHAAQAPAPLTVALYEAHGSSSLCTCVTDKSDRGVAALCAVWCLTSTAATAAAATTDKGKQGNWLLTLRILRQACGAARLDGRIDLGTLHALLETALIALHQAKQERCIVQLFHRAYVQCGDEEREMREAPVPLLWSSRAYTMLAQAAVATNDVDLLLTLCRGSDVEKEEERMMSIQLNADACRARLPPMPEAVYDAALQVIQRHMTTQEQQLVTMRSVRRDWSALAHAVYRLYKQQTRHRECSAVHTPLLRLLNEASRAQSRSYNALARVLAQIRRPDRLVIALAAEYVAKCSKRETAAAVSKMACKVVHMALQTYMTHEEGSTRESEGWLRLIPSIAASLATQDNHAEHPMTCVAVQHLVTALSHCAPFAALVLLRRVTELHMVNREVQETHTAHEEAWAAALAMVHTRLVCFVQAHNLLGVLLSQLYAAWQDDVVTQAIRCTDTHPCAGAQCSPLIHVVLCALHAIQMYDGEAQGEAAALHAMRELHTRIQQQPHSDTHHVDESDGLVARMVALVVQQVVLYASDSVALMQSCLALLRRCAWNTDIHVLHAAYILAVVCTPSHVGSALFPALPDLCMSWLPGSVLHTTATTPCVNEEEMTMRGAALHLVLQVMQVCSAHLTGHILQLASLHERVNDALRDFLLPCRTHAAHEQTSSTRTSLLHHALHAELTVMCALSAAMQSSTQSDDATPQTASHLVTLFLSALHRVRTLLTEHGNGDDETALAQLRELSRRCHTHYDAMVSLPPMHTALVDILELCMQLVHGNTKDDDDDAQDAEYLYEVVWPLLGQLSTTACTTTSSTIVTSHAVIARLQHIAQQLLLRGVHRQSVAVHVAELWCVLTAKTLLPVPPSHCVYERAVLSCGQAVLTVFGGATEGAGVAGQGSKASTNTTTTCLSLSLLLTAIDELTQQQQHRIKDVTRQQDDDDDDVPRGVYALQPWQLRMWHEAALRLLYMTCCEAETGSTQYYKNNYKESAMSWLVRCLPWPCEAGLQESILEHVLPGGTATQLTRVLREMQAILHYYNNRKSEDGVSKELYMSCAAHALRLVQRLMQTARNSRSVPPVLRHEALGAEALLCLAMLSHSTTPSHTALVVPLCMTLLQTFPQVVAQHVLPRWHHGLLSSVQQLGLTHLMHTFLQPSSSSSLCKCMCDGVEVPYVVRRAAMTWLLVSQGSIQRKRNNESSDHTREVCDGVTPFTRLMTLAAPAQAADDAQAQLRHIVQDALAYNEHRDDVAEDKTRTTSVVITSKTAAQQLAEVMTRTTALLVLQYCFPAQMHTELTGSPVLLPHVAPDELSVLLQLTTRHLQQPGQTREITRCNASRTTQHTLLHVLQHRTWQLDYKTDVHEMLNGELLLRLAQCVLAKAAESSNNNNNNNDEAKTHAHDMTAAKLLLQGVLSTSVKPTSWQAFYECMCKDNGASAAAVCDVPEACQLPAQQWPAVLTAVEQWLLRRTLTALHRTPRTASTDNVGVHDEEEEERCMRHVCLACLARRDRGRATRFLLTTLYPRVLQSLVSSLSVSATPHHASCDDDDVITQVASFVHEYVMPFVRHAVQEEQSEAQDIEQQQQQQMLLLFSAVPRVCSDATLIELLMWQQQPQQRPSGRRQPSKAERAALRTLQCDAQELVQLLSRRCLAWCDAHTAKQLKKKSEDKDTEDVHSMTHGDIVYLSAWAQSVVLTGQWQEAHWLARQLILRLQSIFSTRVCTPIACNARHWMSTLVMQLLPVLLCASLRTRNTRAQECLQLLDDLTHIVPENKARLCAMRRFVQGAAAALRGCSERLIRRFTQDAGRAPAYGERLLLIRPVLHVLHAAREAADTSCEKVMQLLLCGSQADQAAWEQYYATQRQRGCCTSTTEEEEDTPPRLTREAVHEAFEVLRKASAAQWQAFLHAEAQPIVRNSRRKKKELPTCTEACEVHEDQEEDDEVGHAWRVVQRAVLSYHEHSPALFAPSALRVLLLQLPSCLPHTPHFISPAMTELLVCAGCADWREAMALLRHSVASARQIQRAQQHDTLRYCCGPVQEYMVVLLLRRVRRSRNINEEERRFCDGLAELCYTFTSHSALTLKSDAAHMVKHTKNEQQHKEKEREDSSRSRDVRNEGAATTSLPHTVRGEVALVCTCLDLLCSSHTTPLPPPSVRQARRGLPQYVLTELLRHAVYDAAVTLALYEWFWSQRYTRLEAGQVFLSLLRAARLAGRQDMALRAMHDMLACCTAASHTHYCSNTSGDDCHPVLAQRHVHAVWLAFVQLCQLGVVSALHASAVRAAYERQGNLLSEVDLLLLGPH